MNVSFITITPTNYRWAVMENFYRAYAALHYKVPMNGKVVLLGNWDFDGHILRGIVSNGPQSALPNSEANG